MQFGVYLALTSRALDAIAEAAAIARIRIHRPTHAAKERIGTVARRSAKSRAQLMTAAVCKQINCKKVLGSILGGRCSSEAIGHRRNLIASTACDDLA